MNRLCRGVAHSYLSREIHTGRWVCVCVVTAEWADMNRLLGGVGIKL